MSEFHRETEQYSFQAAMFVNTESILINNKASIVVRPQLFINDRMASAELLKNCKLTLTTHNFIDQIPVTKKFENLKFKNNKELVLDF